MKKQSSGTEAEFDAVLDIIIRHRERALLARHDSSVQATAAQIELSGFVQPVAGQMSDALWG